MGEYRNRRNVHLIPWIEFYLRYNLDYGCGKGRVDFFLSYQTRCRCLGVEYDERIYEKVMENKKEAVSKERVSFSLANAE